MAKPHAGGRVAVSQNIASLRLRAQGLSLPGVDSPAEIVSRLGAVQAQDYRGALWAVASRMRGATEATIERAIADRSIIRTWPMRGTLHFVAPADARWMLALMASRTMVSNARRLQRDFGLDDARIARCRKIAARALEGGNQLTRDELYGAFAKAGIADAPQSGPHITGRLAHEGTLCFGPRRGKQPTFVLFDEWVPAGQARSRDEALTELALRYFNSRGPATAHDLSWWSGLTLKDAQAALEHAKPKLRRVEVDGGKPMWMSADPVGDMPDRTALLLAPFDEYLVGYKDRSIAIDPKFVRQVIGINGLFNPGIAIDGRIVGTWKRTLKKDAVHIALAPFAPLARTKLSRLRTVARRYGDFLGLPVTIA